MLSLLTGAGHRVRRHTHHGVALHGGLRLLPDVPRAQVRRPPRDLLLRPLLTCTPTDGCTRCSFASSSSSRSLEFRAHPQTCNMSQPRCLSSAHWLTPTRSLCSQVVASCSASLSKPPSLFLLLLLLSFFFSFCAHCSCHIRMHYLRGGPNAPTRFCTFRPDCLMKLQPRVQTPVRTNYSLVFSLLFEHRLLVRTGARECTPWKS